MRRGYLLISIASHFALLATAFFVQMPYTDKPPVLIELNLISESSPSLKPVGRNRFAGNKIKYYRSDVQKILGLQSRPVRVNANHDQLKKPGWTDSQSYSLNAFTDYEGMDMGKIKFIKNLYHLIDNSIVDSPYISEYGHTGSVFLHFDVNADGTFVESSLSANADDGVLKVIAARAVRKAFNAEKEKLVTPNGKISIQARFSWSDNQACNNLKGTHQNYLSFCRFAKFQRKDFSKSEKTLTFLKSLAYGPGMVEEIEKYNKEERRRKSGFDPFEDLRRDPDYNLGS